MLWGRILLMCLEHGHDIYRFEAQHCGVGVDSPQDIALAEGIFERSKTLKTNRSQRGVLWGRILLICLADNVFAKAS